MSLEFIMFAFGAFVVFQSKDMGGFLYLPAEIWLRIGILMFGFGGFALVNSRIDYLFKKNNMKI